VIQEIINFFISIYFWTFQSNASHEDTFSAREIVWTLFTLSLLVVVVVVAVVVVVVVVVAVVVILVVVVQLYLQ
jgi:hypothetical protein